jgi:hypothetical protein
MALIDMAWDVLLALLIPQRESTSHWVGARPGHPISGVGERGVPPFAPTPCNAIFAALGKCIRFGLKEAMPRCLSGAERTVRLSAIPERGNTISRFPLMLSVSQRKERRNG